MRINTCFKNLTSNFLQDQVEYSNQNAFNINNNLISNEKNTDPNNILNNNNYNNGKVKPSGLHETLKSLSAQVKMKMDEDKVNN